MTHLTLPLSSASSTLASSCSRIFHVFGALVVLAGAGCGASEAGNGMDAGPGPAGGSGMAGASTGGSGKGGAAGATEGGAGDGGLADGPGDTGPADRLADAGADEGGEADRIFTVYLSATGSDSNDGLTTATAVRTLNRVEQVLVTHAPTVDVEVRINQGVYVAPQTRWEFFVPGHFISFLPIDYEYGEGISGIASRPVFRGDGSNGYWMFVRLPSGHPGGDTNLRFYYLHIERYSAGGINISGGYETNAAGLRVPTGAGANHNRVFGMTFREMGSKHNSAGIGYAGVVLANSSNNEIRNNHFEYLENLPPDDDLIHGTYTEHGSKRNSISANNFSWISGGPAWFRNDANDNQVFDNRFERTSILAYYGEWFCDAPCTVSHPGHPRECASHGNVFHDNQLISSYDNRQIQLFSLTPPGIDYAGGAGCSNGGQPRVTTYGNN